MELIYKIVHEHTQLHETTNRTPRYLQYIAIYHGSCFTPKNTFKSQYLSEAINNSMALLGCARIRHPFKVVILEPLEEEHGIHNIQHMIPQMFERFAEYFAESAETHRGFFKEEELLLR